MSVENLIIDHLETWTSTIKKRSATGRGSSKKKELYGIKKLRELILDLAVRGQLVPQDPNDEPADKLLERIQAEKQQLIQQGKIKKQKPLPPITEAEKPFDLPKGWAWARLGDIGDWGSGSTPKRDISDYYNGDIPWFKSGELSTDYITHSEEKITKQALKETSLRLNKIGDVLVAMYGATIGKTSILSVEATTNQAVCACTTYKGISNVYLLTLLKGYKKRLINMGAGGAQPNISRDKIVKTVVAIPPIFEQDRIVTKVDELMALCDQLEQQTEASISAHQTLVKQLLETLIQSADAKELMHNWQRISDHFEWLLTTEESVEQLKSTILQLAVMGKLVPQDPNDEPADKLLERIQAEKQQLIQKGKIKKQKPLPPITDEEKPFDLPKGWAWARLDDICSDITSGSTPHKDYFSNSEGIPYLKVYNIRNQKVDFDYKAQYISSDYHSTKNRRSILYPNDVIMNIVGPPLGKVAIVPDNFPEWNCNQAIVLFRPVLYKLSKYIYLYLNSKIFLKNMELIGTAGQDNISITKSRNILIPMPATKEQYLIVDQVNALIMICDQLKERIQQKNITQQKTTDALIF
jgi:type I restriction enzyme S subunit